jgi:hypothetical protein
MEAARTSETLVNFYQTTRCYNPEDSNLPSGYPTKFLYAFLTSPMRVAWPAHQSFWILSPLYSVKQTNCGASRKRLEVLTALKISAELVNHTVSRPGRPQSISSHWALRIPWTHVLPLRWNQVSHPNKRPGKVAYIWWDFRYEDDGLLRCCAV